MTGRTFTRAGSGNPSRRPDHAPAATTTCSASTSSPPASRTPLTRPAPSSIDPTSASVRRSTPARRHASASAAVSARGSIAWSSGISSASLTPGARPARAARLARPQSPDLEAEALPHRQLTLERLGLVAVARDEHRAARQIAGVDAGGLPEARRRRPDRPRRSPARARAAAARAGSPRSPARASPPRPTRLRHQRTAFEHRHAQSTPGRAPCDSETDRAAPGDGHVK